MKPFPGWQYVLFPLSFTFIGFKKLSPNPHFYCIFLQTWRRKQSKIKFSGLQTVFLQGGGEEYEWIFGFAEYEGGGRGGKGGGRFLSYELQIVQTPSLILSTPYSVKAQNQNKKASSLTKPWLCGSLCPSDININPSVYWISTGGNHSTVFTHLNTDLHASLFLHLSLFNCLFLPCILWPQDQLSSLKGYRKS